MGLNPSNSLRASMVCLAATAIGAAVAVGAIGFWSEERMDAAATVALTAKDVVADILPPPMYLIEARLVLSLAADGTLAPAEAARQWQRLHDEYRARVDHWRRNPPFGLERLLLGRQHDAGLKFLEHARRAVLEPLAAGDAAAARAALPDVHRLYLEHRAGVDETVSAGNALAAQSMTDFAAARRGATLATAAVLAAAVSALLAVIGWSMRSVERPVQRCLERARRIASGDLTGDAGAHGRRADAIGALEAELARMQSQLAAIVADVRAGADGVATAAGQIAAGNADLSSRTERTAANLQQAAASVEQLAATVGNGAERAAQADRLAHSTAEVARRASEVVGQVVATMQEIDADSKRIAEIIGVIDGIAFQTNILALNAAVEAARAGETGRGFAVVAAEVRTLAQRTAQAAREIKALIGASVQKTSNGARLVGEAGGTMQEAVASVQRVADLIGEISAAAREQSAGIGEVNTVVGELDRMTQQNAALVEQSAAAADSLKAQARRLAESIARFRVAAERPAALPA